MGGIPGGIVKVGEVRGATGSEVRVRQDAVEMPGAMALPDRQAGEDVGKMGGDHG
jgi:hypothetical protein